MSKTLQQFREWAIKTKSVGNPSGNSYKGECVSLIQQYINQVFGIPYVARGHAAWYTPPASHFKQLPANTALKPGDIVRYGTNYGWGYGHIGMIDDRGQYLDQNGVVARAVGTRSKPFSDIRAVFRPTKAFTVKTPKPKATAKTGRIARKGTARVTVDALNVRNSPSTSSKVVATYKKGQTFVYDSYQIANGYVWLSYVSYSGQRRYVAEGPYDGTPTVWVSGGVG